MDRPELSVQCHSVRGWVPQDSKELVEVLWSGVLSSSSQSSPCCWPLQGSGLVLERQETCKQGSLKLGGPSPFHLHCMDCFPWGTYSLQWGMDHL